MLSFAR